MVGKEQTLRDYVKHLQSKGWNIEEKGPFRIGDKFHYLKREFRLCRDWCDIRYDYKQYGSLAEGTNVYCKAYRKTPMDQSFAKRGEPPQLEGEDIAKFRSVVGRLMYLAGERPASRPRHGSVRSTCVPTCKGPWDLGCASAAGRKDNPWWTREKEMRLKRKRSI